MATLRGVMMTSLWLVASVQAAWCGLLPFHARAEKFVCLKLFPKSHQTEILVVEKPLSSTEVVLQGNDSWVLLLKQWLVGAYTVSYSSKIVLF